jgi:hypothetical protein
VGLFGGVAKGILIVVIQDSPLQFAALRFEVRELATGNLGNAPPRCDFEVAVQYC